MADYIIERTQPHIYLDNRGRAVNGFLVLVALPEFGEGHEVSVPDLKADTVALAIQELLDNRRKLAALGA